MPAVTLYENHGFNRFAEVRLNSGEMVRIELDGDGARVLHRVPGRGRGRLIYRGDPDNVAWICAALLDRHAPSAAPGPDPLNVLLNALVHFACVDDMEAAFTEAQRRPSWFQIIRDKLAGL